LAEPTFRRQLQLLCLNWGQVVTDCALSWGIGDRRAHRTAPCCGDYVSLEPLDAAPPFDLDLTPGIVRRTGRTLVPAAEHAFEIVRKCLQGDGGPPGPLVTTRSDDRTRNL
jgi:hypothetical protein